MPTYQYECQACGHAFEELQEMSEAKLTKCPKCRKSKLARLIGGGAGMIFKGAGFYANDYKKQTVASESKPAAKPAGPCGNACGCHPHAG